MGREDGGGGGREKEGGGENVEQELRFTWKQAPPDFLVFMEVKSQG